MSDVEIVLWSFSFLLFIGFTIGVILGTAGAVIKVMWKYAPGFAVAGLIIFFLSVLGLI